MKKRQKHSPFSLRLSAEEKALLKRQAGDMALGEYIRSQILDKPEPRKPIRQKNQEHIKDYEAIAQILALLGNSDISANLRYISYALKHSSLIITDDTEIHLQRACLVLDDIKTLLLKALGLGVQQ